MYLPSQTRGTPTRVISCSFRVKRCHLRGSARQIHYENATSQSEINQLLAWTVERKRVKEAQFSKPCIKDNDSSLGFTSSKQSLLQIYQMSFIFPFVILVNPNASPYQFYQVSQPSYFINPYQTSIFYPNLTLLPEQNPLIFTTNFSTQDSLTGIVAQKPHTKKKKSSTKQDSDQSFGWRIQNIDRNIMSNILKAFVNHIHDGVGMRSYIEQLFAKLDLQNDVSEFYIFFKQHFSVNSSYISAKTVKHLLHDVSLPASLLFVLKLVLNRFFRVEFSLVLLKSNRIRRRSKLEQMKKSRQLLQSLFRE